MAVAESNESLTIPNIQARFELKPSQVFRDEDAAAPTTKQAERIIALALKSGVSLDALQSVYLKTARGIFEAQSGTMDIYHNNVSIESVVSQLESTAPEQWSYDLTKVEIPSDVKQMLVISPETVKQAETRVNRSLLIDNNINIDA
jgi:hypothetical protein